MSYTQRHAMSLSLLHLFTSFISMKATHRLVWQ